MKKNILLSIISGLLLWIAWPPTAYTTILLFVAFVPMLLAMEDIINSTSYTNKGRKLFWTAFLGFFIWNTLCIYWVYNSLKDAGAIIAIFIALIPYSLGPLLMSTACWLYYRLRRITSRNFALADLVVFWIGYEYLHQNWDLNFPWMTLGNGFAVSHSWVQWYEFTGVYGGTIWILLVNILLFLAYTKLAENDNRKKVFKTAAFGIVVFVLPLIFSLITYYTYKEAENPSNIVIVQPNIDPYEKEGKISHTKQIEILTRLSDSLAQPNTEFFIWPETAISGYMNEDKIRADSLFILAKGFIKKYKNGNLITGAETFRLYNSRKTPTASPANEAGTMFYDSYNTALNIENSGQLQFYHKSKLVPGAEELPFGEALSFLKPAFEHLGGSTGGYAGQPEPGVFYSQSGIGADPVICYESIWGEYVAESVKRGAQFIAIITNDGWWGNTSGKDQHLEYAKLRAIETRRWVCRSANTGISAFINQRGDIVKHSDWWVKAAMKHDINLNSDITFYTQYGDFIPKGISILAAGGIFWVIFNLRLRRRNVKLSGSK
ncbi:apolipoprotein N-acyltransferase [Mucilaginibacter limnophilus]|uniref:Apolipoprotein N-acyltransferase n=1 Tax=Mucilaginibacter limnophilus TaxID=1932778 RepID=A0A3S2VN81_9SPHI|nr:apolipoprotein N-acyltransferase [Mucilaginibacter limnophilus]RVU01327.1 apolipoprotein N-acyltransferase [Mucilaginibacter limnophilus]